MFCDEKQRIYWRHYSSTRREESRKAQKFLVPMCNVVPVRKKEKGAAAATLSIANSDFR